MEKEMKLIASYFLYYLGHTISILLYCDLLSFLYPLYNKVMQISVELDEHEKVWSRPS